MEALPGIWSLTPLGGLVGLLILMWWLLATGRLIPRTSHEREMGYMKKRGDEWKETAMEERKVKTEALQQNSALIEANRTAAKFFGDVTPTIEDTGDHHVAP